MLLCVYFSYKKQNKTKLDILCIKMTNIRKKGLMFAVSLHKPSILFILSVSGPYGDSFKLTSSSSYAPSSSSWSLSSEPTGQKSDVYRFNGSL